eukprot:TRINITY_DN278_c0_g1_i1.p1 TRINITY_DN278_c0_g1~~TRINITY_DN278_c0_g1_i1.p1  ORF type:complete len:480 (+),score=32.61 TRINITY_DN278_c0_g1_i1:1861-3300(+)
MSSENVQKAASVIISLLSHRDTLLSCQIHSLCLKSGFNQAPYECGYFCTTCSEPVCIICAHRCHQGHQLSPLGIVPDFECLCEMTGVCSAMLPLPMPMHVRFPEEVFCSTNILFRYDPEVLKEDNKEFSYISKECSTGTLIGAKPICTVGPDFIMDSMDYSPTAGYFEVEILLGGTYDQIAIGLTTDENYPLDEFAGYKDISVAFHGDDGKCYISGQSITYGCKFGSYDTIGCGVTQNGDVYFTYNGMILPLMNLQLSGEIYPAVSLRGKFTSVRVNMGPDFDFESSRLLDLPNPLMGNILVNAELLQYLLDNPAFYDKVLELASSKGVKAETSNVLKSVLMSERHHKNYFHNRQSSLFNTKTSEVEETKGKAHKHGHFGNNAPIGVITERGCKADNGKGNSESEMYEEYTNTNTHNDLKHLEGATSEKRQAPVPKINVERIGDLPPLANTKKAERKAMGGTRHKTCTCTTGKSTCNIF